MISYAKFNDFRDRANETIIFFHIRQMVNHFFLSRTESGKVEKINSRNLRIVNRFFFVLFPEGWEGCFFKKCSSTPYLILLTRDFYSPMIRLETANTCCKNKFIDIDLFSLLMRFLTKLNKNDACVGSVFAVRSYYRLSKIKKTRNC